MLFNFTLFAGILEFILAILEVAKPQNATGWVIRVLVVEFIITIAIGRVAYAIKNGIKVIQGDMNSSNNNKFSNVNNNTNTNTNTNDTSENQNLQKYKNHPMKQEITGDCFFKHRKTTQGHKY